MRENDNNLSDDTNMVIFVYPFNDPINMVPVG